jgi:hypothetical protein
MSTRFVKEMSNKDRKHKVTHDTPWFAVHSFDLDSGLAGPSKKNEDIFIN